AFSQLIVTLVTVPQGTTAGFVRRIAAYQATLGQIDTFVAVVEQLEWDIRTILPARILWQGQLNDVTALRVDGQVQNVGSDANQLVTDGSRYGQLCIGFVTGSRNVVDNIA